MPIDPSIAMGLKPVQIESPINQMAKAYEMQNAIQTNELNKLKMDEYKRGLAEQEQFKNALGSATDDAAIRNAFYSLGEKGVKGYQDYLKSQAEQKKLGVETQNLGYTGQKTQGEVLKAKQDFLKSALRDISSNPSDENIIAWGQDAINNGHMNLDEAKMQVGRLLAIPQNQRQAFLASQGATSAELKPHFVNQENVMVNGVPTTRVLQMDAFGGPASTVAGSTGATYNKPAANITINNAQEKEFEKQLGAGQAKAILESKGKAEDAAQILATNKVAKNLLDQGALTGVGAEFFTKLNQGLSQAGIDFGYADAARNSQAYGGLMATNTAKLIKNFGAGTGLSDADRQYAKQAAAGDITIDEKAIRKLIDINNRAAQNVIKLHNKNVSGIKTNIPLSVNPEDFSAGIPEGRATAPAKVGGKTLDEIFSGR